MADRQGGTGSGESTADPAGLPANFWRLWASSISSNLGDGVRLTALPLLAAALDPRPVVVSLLSAVGYLPWLLLSLVAGGVADRVDRRRLMIRIQVLRVILVGGFAALVALGTAQVVILLAFALAMGVAEVFFDTTAQTALPALVATDQLERGNSRLFAAEVTANEFVGPPLGSVLFAWVQAAPFWLATVGHGVSALMLGRIRSSFNPPGETHEVPPPQPLRAAIAAGLRLAIRSSFLRSWTLLLAATNLARAMTVSVFVLYVLQLLDDSELLFGLLSAAVAVGGVVGGWQAEKVIARVGRRAAVAGALAATFASHLLFGTIVQVIVAAVAGFLIGAAVAVLNVVFISQRQSVVPAQYLGRVASVQRFASWGALPLGAVLGGWLAQEFGLRVPYLVAAAVTLLASTILWRRIVDFPLAPLAVDGRS